MRNRLRAADANPLNDLRNWMVVGSGYSNLNEAARSVLDPTATGAVSFVSRHEFMGSGNYIRVVYGFYKANGNVGESSLSNEVTLHAAFQGINDAAPRELTFNGANRVTKQYGVAISDPIPFTYYEGMVGFALQALSVPDPALLIPGTWTGLSDPDRENIPLGEAYMVGDVIMNGRTAMGNQAANNRMYGPIAILGYYPGGNGAPQSMLIQGDSHIAGTGDAGMGRSMGGWVQRWCNQQVASTTYNTALACRCPFVPLAKGGESSREWLDNESKVRRVMRDYVTDIFLQASNHDAENGASTATWQAVLRELIGWASLGRHVKRIYMCTAYPKASSTDAFYTATNQTPIITSGRTGTINPLVIDTSASGLGATSPIRGQSFSGFDVTTVFEVDAANALTVGGGRFIVGDTTADYTGSMSSLSPNQASVNGGRINITGLTDTTIMNKCVLRWTSGANIGETRNVEYATPKTDGTYFVVLSPALPNIPENGATFELFVVDSSTYKGVSTDGGVHNLRNSHLRIANYVNGLGLMLKSNIAPATPITPPVAEFDPLEWGTPLRIYDFSDLGRMYQDSAKTTPVAADLNPIGAIQGTLIGATTYGLELHQAQAGAGGTRDKRPIWHENYLNSQYGAAVFDGVDDFLKDADATSYNQPFTRFFVMKMLATTYGATASVMDTSISGTTSRHQLTCTTVGSRQYSAGTAVSAGSWNTNYVVVAVVYNSAPAGAVASKCFVNGVQVGSTGNAGNNPSTGLWIGGNRSNAETDTAGTGTVNMALTYMLSYNAVISDADIATMSAQISNKFGGIY